jgi:hypothetical protein
LRGGIEKRSAEMHESSSAAQNKIDLSGKVFCVNIVARRFISASLGSP